MKVNTVDVFLSTYENRRMQPSEIILRGREGKEENNWKG
jgi:hypothetical protein